MNAPRIPISRTTHSGPRAFGIALLGGAASWLAFLSYGGMPFATWQVVGAALAVGVGTVASRSTARGGGLVATVAGVTLGFWCPWTLAAASYGETGLFLVGAALLLGGLVLSPLLTAVVADAILHHRRSGR